LIQGNAAFLKKSSKKLLLLWTLGVCGVSLHGPANKSLFAFFSREKEGRACLKASSPA
jgi:hypothetical protein